jgi:hypothetical protein
VSSENHEERELDRLLLVLSQPLTRLILSVLAGVDPGIDTRNVPLEINHSNDMSEERASN